MRKIERAIFEGRDIEALKLRSEAKGADMPGAKRAIDAPRPNSAWPSQRIFATRRHAPDASGQSQRRVQ